MRRNNSEINSAPSAFTGPRVSKAIGTNMWVAGNNAYLADLRTVTCTAYYYYFYYYCYFFLPEVPWIHLELQKLSGEVKMYSGTPKTRQDPAVQKSL